jgi:hypothetical protein
MQQQSQRWCQGYTEISQGPIPPSVLNNEPNANMSGGLDDPFDQPTRETEEQEPQASFAPSLL